MKLGAFTNTDEALAAFEVVLPKVKWGRQLLDENAPPGIVFAAGKTADWLTFNVVMWKRSEALYDGSAAHESGLILRLPPKVARRAFEVACLGLYKKLLTLD